MVVWLGDALASFPGPFRTATLVHAATTRTGDWYVIAGDREDAYDDGTPTHHGLRVLGLTNGLDGGHMIPIGQGLMGRKPTITWENVDWRGATLAAGQRAAARAVECLDRQWASL